jgi:hypothetical protein
LVNSLKEIHGQNKFKYWSPQTMNANRLLHWDSSPSRRKLITWVFPVKFLALKKGEDLR